MRQRPAAPSTVGNSYSSNSFDRHSSNESEKDSGRKEKDAKNKKKAPKPMKRSPRRKIKDEEDDKKKHVRKAPRKKQMDPEDSDYDDDDEDNEKIEKGDGDEDKEGSEEDEGDERGEEEDEDEENDGLPSWKVLDTRCSKVPSDLTITHVNQTWDLMRVTGIPGAADFQNSVEWLETHSVESLKLSIKDLIDRGRIGNPVPEKDTGKLCQHIQFEAADINEFEFRLHEAIEKYTKRIKWLLAGSKRVFGMLKGSRVAVCIDSSDANCGCGRLGAFQQSMLHLIDEQLSDKKSMYLLSFGTDIHPAWQCVRDINCRIINEAKQFVMELHPSGGCNLLKAMKKVMSLKNIDSILLILGSVPDQTSEIMVDYVHQLAAGKAIPLHTVAYDCSNHLTNITLRKLAEESMGRYHCYTATCEEQIYTSTDISIILKEIQKAQDVINKIKEMRQGMMGSAIISILNEISHEVAKLPQTRFLPRPPGHDRELKLQTPRFQPSSSDQWLRQHGLKAKKLDLYQVLAPNAYAYKEEFIPVIRKTVQSQTHERAMTQFTWRDGSLKNVHVDMAQLFEYQKQLGAAVKLYEKRIAWLSSLSRKIFGTVIEKNVVIMLDLSVSNCNYLVHIQHSLRLLMEQQFSNKEYFNIIGFGSDARAFRPSMVPATPENMQAAWRWVLELQCGGSRNFMAGLRLALENEAQRKNGIDVHGIYLFTSGIPDQPADVLCAFAEEVSAGVGLHLHTILFNVDDYDASGAIPSRYANITKTADALRTLAHSTRGRFHWFRETGIIESDDIAILTEEIERAMNFSKKCAMLIDSVKRKYTPKKIADSESLMEMMKLPAPPKMKAILPPRVPACAISNTEEYRERRAIGPPRPTSARKEIQAAGPKSRRPAKDPMLSVRTESNKAIQSAFYTEEKNKSAQIGMTYKSYPVNKSVRKGVPTPVIPAREEQVSSREWLKLYGLNKLKLDLNRLVSGPDCKHEESELKVLQHKHVSAKYCDIFPSINVKGTIKHLQLLPHELHQYEKHIDTVLQRYIKRLQWLLGGSRRIFGTIVHKRCVVLIDTSGSMEAHMTELKKQLTALIWEQLFPIKAEFNLIRFSANTEPWQDHLVRATEDTCHQAIAWISSLRAAGNTCTLDALETAFQDSDVEALYVLTDGKPDHSTAMVLREVNEWNKERNIAINTISFNCSDSTANNFLKSLSRETGGRYHRCQTNFDADLLIHKLLVNETPDDAVLPHMPEFDGDDLRLMANEISKARRYLCQSRVYRGLIEKTKTEDASSQEKVPPKPVFVVGRPRNVKM